MRRRDTPGSSIRLGALGLLLLGPAFACTDADVFLPMVEPPPQREVEPNRLTGRFCTEDPKTIVFPVKVWLVIDDSGSMMESDPNQRRYSAVKELASRLSSPGKVFFGGMVFSEQQIARFSNPRFNDDVARFSAQVPGSPGAGATPYLGALDLTLSELKADIDEDKVKAKRTRYVVIFLSDGVPTSPDPTSPSDVLSRVDSIVALATSSGGVTLNTVFLGGAGGDAAIGILRDMADHGKGQFKSFTNGDQLDYTGFDFSTIQRAYAQRFFLATNRSMAPTATGQAVDSDHDGLDDATEAALGTSPILADTDGDGCSDTVEHRLGWSPTAKVTGQCTCAESAARQDADHDGLNDCEETWVGTLPDDPDSDIGKASATDGDLVPDGLDFTQLQDPTFPNTSSDRDLDGSSDLEELRVHTDVTADDKERARWAYRYPVFQRESEESRCYRFEVHNLTLGRTLATTEHPAGENVVELYLVQSSQDDPHRDRFYRVARKLVPYTEGDQVIEVEPSDFNQVLGVH
jgi:hypothetical protein